MDATPNRPEVVAEVAALFERYEQALIDKDVAVLDATFWDSPHTIRYAVRENGYGFDAIHAARVGGQASARRHQGDADPAGDPDAGHRPRDGEPRIQAARPRRIGRQSQTWVRFPGLAGASSRRMCRLCRRPNDRPRVRRVDGAAREAPAGGAVERSGGTPEHRS